MKKTSKTSYLFSCILIAIIANLTSAIFAQGEDRGNKASKQSGEALKILVFGNSFSHCIIEDLPGFAKSAKMKPPEVRCLRIAGLEKYWKSIEAGEKDPKSPGAMVALETDYKAKVSTTEEIKSKKWDIIVLQQHSSMSADKDEYIPYAKNIYEYCKKFNPDARYLFYQTHAYRDDCLKYRATSNKIFRNPYSEDEMHKDIQNCVLTVAKDLNIEVVPVGEAFQVARYSPLWGYNFPDTKFDYENAKPPAVPDEKNTLHIGFRWLDKPIKTGRNYQVDNHPNNFGRYLGGAVFYEIIYGKSCEEVKYVPDSKNKKSKSDLDTASDKNITPEKALALRKIAHEAVESEKRK